MYKASGMDHFWSRPVFLNLFFMIIPQSIFRHFFPNRLIHEILIPCICLFMYYMYIGVYLYIFIHKKNKNFLFLFFPPKSLIFHFRDDIISTTLSHPYPFPHPPTCPSFPIMNAWSKAMITILFPVSPPALKLGWPCNPAITQKDTYLRGL